MNFLQIRLSGASATTRGRRIRSATEPQAFVRPGNAHLFSNHETANKAFFISQLRQFFSDAVEVETGLVH